MTIRELVAVISAKVDGYVGPMKSVLTVTNDVGKSWKTFAADAASMATRVTASLVAVGAAAVAMAGAFEDQTQQIQNMMTAVPEAEFKRLENGIRKLSVEFGRGTGMIAEGVFEIMSSGGNLQTVLSDLNGLMPLVVAGQASLGDSVKLVANIVNAYHLEWSQTAAITDRLFKTNELGVTSIQQLAGSLANLTDLAFTAGISLDEMFAVVASGSISSPSTAETVTRLSSAMRTLLAGSDELNAVYQRAGFATSEQAVRTIGLTRAAKILTDATKGETGALIELTGRSEAALGILSIAGDNFDRTTRFITEMANATGVASAAMKSAMDNGIEGIRRGGEFLKDLFLEIGLQILPDVAKAFNMLTVRLTEHKDLIIGSAVDAYKDLIVQAMRLGEGLGSIIPQAIEFARAIAGIVAAVVGFAAAHPTLTAFLMALSVANLLGITKAVTSLAIALGTTGKAVVSFFAVTNGASGFTTMTTGIATFVGWLKTIPTLIMVQIIPSFLAWMMTITNTNTVIASLKAMMSTVGIVSASAVGIAAAAYLTLLPLARRYREELDKMTESGDRIRGVYRELGKEDALRAADGLASTDVKDVEARLAKEKEILETRKQQAAAAKQTLEDFESGPGGIEGAIVTPIMGITDRIGLTDSGAPEADIRKSAEEAQAMTEAATDNVRNLESHLGRLRKAEEDFARTYGGALGEGAKNPLEDAAEGAGGVLGEAAGKALDEEMEKQRKKAIETELERGDNRQLEGSNPKFAGAGNVNDFLKNNPQAHEFFQYLEGLTELTAGQEEELFETYKLYMNRAKENGEEQMNQWDRMELARDVAAAKNKAKRDEENEKKQLENKQSGAVEARDALDLDSAFALQFGVGDAATMRIVLPELVGYLESLDGVTEKNIESIREFIAVRGKDGELTKAERDEIAIKIAQEAEAAAEAKRAEEQKKEQRKRDRETAIEEEKAFSKALNEADIPSEKWMEYVVASGALKEQLDNGSLSAEEYRKRLAGMNGALAADLEFTKQLKEGQKGGLSKGTADSLQKEFDTLRKKLFDGKISLADYTKELDKLKKKTEEATEAERRAAIMRGDWKGAGLDLRKEVEDRMLQTQMSRFDAMAQQMADAAMGVGQSVERGMSQFETAFVGGMGGAAFMNGDADAGNLGKIWEMLASPQGAINSLISQIELLEQTYQMMVDIDAEQARMTLEAIDELSRQLDLLRNQEPYFTETNGPAFVRDPGLTGDSDSEGGSTRGGRGSMDIRINTPAGYSQGDIATLVDDLERELARRGRSMF